MKNYLKKGLCIIAVIALVLSMTACGKPSVEKYVKENGQTMVDLMEKQFTSMGMDCDCEVTARDNKIVVKIMSDQFDGLDDDTKALMKKAFEDMKGELKSMVAIGKDEVKGLKGIVYEICDSNGELVADVDIDL